MCKTGGSPSGNTQGNKSIMNKSLAKKVVPVALAVVSVTGVAAVTIGGDLTSLGSNDTPTYESAGDITIVGIGISKDGRVYVTYSDGVTEIW